MKITWTDKKITIDGEGLEIPFYNGELAINCPCVEDCPFPTDITNFNAKWIGERPVPPEENP
jgi:hypothetical protein